MAYNPDRRRRSSVAEQPPCKRQVVCSIQTGGTNVRTLKHSVHGLRRGDLRRRCRGGLALSRRRKNMHRETQGPARQREITPSQLPGTSARQSAATCPTSNRV